LKRDDRVRVFPFFGKRYIFVICGRKEKMNQQQQGDRYATISPAPSSWELAAPMQPTLDTRVTPTPTATKLKPYKLQPKKNLGSSSVAIHVSSVQQDPTRAPVFTSGWDLDSSHWDLKNSAELTQQRLSAEDEFDQFLLGSSIVSPVFSSSWTLPADASQDYLSASKSKSKINLYEDDISKLISSPLFNSTATLDMGALKVGKEDDAAEKVYREIRGNATKKFEFRGSSYLGTELQTEILRRYE
jgi:hypothetical protein